MPAALRLRKLSLSLATALAAMLVVIPASRPATGAVALTPVPDLAHRLRVEVNAARRARDLTPLTISPRLAHAADAHARILGSTGTFTHDWSDGRPFAVWIRRFYPAQGFRSWAAGENLLWATPSLDAQDAVRQWLASPPHRRILLAQRWRSIGIAVIKADGAGGVYGTGEIEIAAAEFGARRR